MDYRNEDRVTDALETTRSVTFDGQTHTYSPDIQWGTGDFEDAYPVVVLSYEQEAGQRDTDQPINDLLDIDEKVGEPDIDIHEVSRVRDLIRVTVAVDENRDDNGVPGHLKCEQIAMDVWTQFRFSLKLNKTGSNGARPVLFGVDDPPSGPQNEDNIVRSRFTIQADYMIVNTRNVDSIADVDTTTNTNN